MRKMAISVLLALVALVPCWAGDQRIVYVDDDARGTDDGSSWDNAFRYLYDALEAAQAAKKPVEVRVAQGLYRPDLSRAEIPSTRSPRYGPVGTRRDVVFEVSYGIALAGGYAGLGAADPNECNPASYRTILSGDLDGNDEPGIYVFDLATHPSRQDNAYTVIRIRGRDPVGPITGLEIEGASESALLIGPGGSSWDPLFVSDCIFRNNSGIEGGAVLIANYLDDATVVDRCRFYANYADHGGAIAVNSSSVTIRNTVLAGNCARQSGGAILAREPVSITACTFVGNRAQEGGALACPADGQWPTDSRLTVANCILRDGGNEISNHTANRLDVRYCNIQGGWPGAAILDADPCFTAPGRWDTNGTPDDPNDDTWIEGDYHLKSTSGRWDPSLGTWVQDQVDSPCIDAGDVYSSYANEPWPHGLRPNQGAYADTSEASLSSSPSGSVADLNSDGVVDVDDLARLADRWLDKSPLIAEDLNRDGRVDARDFGVLAAEWQAERTEVRLTEYWPLIPGNRWANATVIYDGGIYIRTVDRYAINGLDVAEIRYSFGDRWGIGSSYTRYFVYVDGGLYRTSNRSDLDRLPDVSTGFRLEWPEIFKIGRSFDDAYYGSLTPFRTTLHELATLVEEQNAVWILKTYPPEYHNLDVLAFINANEHIVYAFGRGYGPVFDNQIWMERTQSSP